MWVYSSHSSAVRWRDRPGEHSRLVEVFAVPQEYQPSAWSTNATMIGLVRSCSSCPQASRYPEAAILIATAARTRIANPAKVYIIRRSERKLAMPGNPMVGVPNRSDAPEGKAERGLSTPAPAEASSNIPSASKPFSVDLDGTVIRTDFPIEGALSPDYGPAQIDRRMLTPNDGTFKQQGGKLAELDPNFLSCDPELTDSCASINAWGAGSCPHRQPASR
jgi:hypothetical protein